MIEESGLVVAVRGDLAEVESQRRSACGTCTVNGACGTSLLDRFFGRKQLILTVRNPIGAEPGDSVVLGVPESAMLEASFAAYVVPLLTMFLGGMGGAHAAVLVSPEHVQGLSVLGGGTGLAVGLWWLAGFGKRRVEDERYQPIILRRASGGQAEVRLSLNGVPGVMDGGRRSRPDESR